MRWLLSGAAAAALLTCATVARAVSPDFEGERGIEAHFTLGYGSLFNTSERVFQSPREASGASQPAPALVGGLNFRLGAGYRLTPFLSAGATMEWQGMGALPLGPSGGRNEEWSAGAIAFGVYGRLYPMAFTSGALNMPRVNFNAADQSLRRWEPWVSLGIEYHALWRNVTITGTRYGANWNSQGVRVPIAAGFDVRVIPSLALGVALGIAPVISAGIGRTATAEVLGNVVTTSSNYDSAAPLNATWFIGLGARYTLTF